MHGTEEQRNQIKALTLDGMQPLFIAARMQVSVTTVTTMIDEMGLWRPRFGRTNFLMTEPPDWMDDSICAEVDPEAFFPEAGTWAKAAKRVCMGCEARVACLDYAIEHDERFGIWGGKSERERRKIRRDRVTESMHGTDTRYGSDEDGVRPGEGHEAREG